MWSYLLKVLHCRSKCTRFRMIGKNKQTKKNQKGDAVPRIHPTRRQTPPFDATDSTLNQPHQDPLHSMQEAPTSPTMRKRHSVYPRDPDFHSICSPITRHDRTSTSSKFQYEDYFSDLNIPRTNCLPSTQVRTHYSRRSTSRASQLDCGDGA